MKRLKLLSILALAAGIFSFTSCSSSDDNNPTVDKTPTLTFIGGTDYISTNTSVPQGNVYKIGVNAFSNTSTNANLVKLNVTRVYNNTPVTWDTTFNKNSFTVSFTDTAKLIGDTKWIFRVTDKDNQYKEISLTITTTAAAGEINTFTQKIMGAQGSPTGSSFASIDGTVYNLADAKLNAAKVDWMYYYGATNEATIAAPDDPTAAEVFSAANGPASWSVRNATRFKKVTDPVVWNSITDDEIIVAQTASGVDQSKITHLAVGDVLSFIAANGKKGMIKVESITGTDAGTINISVKVQK